jgi:cytochrome c biogenesis protein CcmG, thiol:disulfide interchange protein DsbE
VRLAQRRIALACLAILAVGVTGCSAGSAGTDGGTTPAPARSSSAVAARGLPSCVAPPPAGGTVDRGLPDITLDCLVGGAAVKLSDLRGKPMVVNVWAQWCGPCRQEAPYLAQLADRVAASGRIALLGVDIADPRPELAIAFAAEHGWRYPHLKDPDKLLVEPLNLAGPPATAFVDAGGEVRYLHLGPFTSYDQLERMVRDNLGVTP